MYIYFAACCIPCTKVASLLRQEQAINGQDFFFLHMTTVALEKWEEFFNDKSLFGSLKIDGNLTKEGNTILGGARGADADSSDDDSNS